jgi:serine/threonine protein kinase/Tfp pilus assembly protein PilF
MIGKVIAHYRIIEKIGQGGMGEIYLAEDVKLERQVALKFLPRHLTEDCEARTRFEREAKAAAALNHPNIVTVYEIGEHEGQVFIAMEYVAGETLKEMISGSVGEEPRVCPDSIGIQKEGEHRGSPLPITHRPFPINQVIDIATQIASGLAAAHAKGIVHRDVKPQNILVDKDGRVKILDFGLAKLKSVSSLTKESSTLGTVHYMSPEQTMGKEVDHRTDIWSLGVALYEMLTGKLPFKGDYEQAVIYSILNEDPEKPTEIRKDIQAEFECILEKILAKDPAERYQHADDLLVDLKHLKRDSQPDRKPAPMVLRRKARHWMRWGIPGAVTLLVVVAAALFFIIGGKTKPGPSIATKTASAVQVSWSRSIAVLPFKNLSDRKEDEYFSDGITEDIIAQLSKISDLKVISRTSVMRFKGTSKSIPEIGSELNVGTVLEGSVRHAGSQVRIVAQLIDARNEGHLWADTYDMELTQVFAIQSDVAQKIAFALKAKLSAGEKERIETRQTENPKAYELYLKGRFHWNRRSTNDFQKAIAYFKQALDEDPDYAKAYAGLAISYVLMPDYGFPTKEYYPKAKEAATRALEIDPSLAEAHTVMANLSEIYYDWAKAESGFKRAIELDPGYPTVRHWYSQMLCALGRLDEGLAEARRAAELDPLSLIINTNLGRVLFCLRQYDQAIDQFNKVIELDPNFPWSYYFLGIVLEQQGKLNEAMEEYQKAKRLAADHFIMWGDIGRCYARAGIRGSAQQVLRELQEYWKKGYAVSFGIADVYYGLGDMDPSFVWYEKSIQDHETGILGITAPLYDGLRSDPRYSVLMKKAGLEK